MNETKWDGAEKYLGGADWIPMRGIDLDFLIVYQAPTGNVARAPLPPEQRRRRSGAPISPSDLETIDDDTDKYLAMAGVPPVPRNYQWYVRRPQGMADEDFFRLIHAAVYDNWPDDNMPNHHLAPLGRALAELYSHR